MAYIVAIVVLFLVGLVVMNDLTKKGYFKELESVLELKEFQLQTSGGKAVAVASWKSMKFQIVANYKMLVRQADINFIAEHRFDFSANITPGPALSTAQAGTKVKKGDDEATARPWRVKLTAEEQKIIDERRGTETPVEVPLDKFVVRSNKADVSAKFLQSAEHSEALEALFKEGISEVRFSNQGLTVVKSSFDNSDLLPKQVEKYLTRMKALIG